MQRSSSGLPIEGHGECETLGEVRRETRQGLCIAVFHPQQLAPLREHAKERKA